MLNASEKNTNIIPDQTIRKSTSRSKSQKLLSLFMAIALGIFVLWLTRPLLIESGMPWGTDVYGHLARVWYMATSFRETGVVPQWFPYWYNGTPLTQYYPPLSVFLMLPIQLVTDNIYITYRIAVVGCLLLTGIVTFFLLCRKSSPQWAALGTALYISAPYTVRTIFDEGNLPRTFDLLLMPIVLFLTLDLLENGRRRSFLGLVATSTILCLMHHQQAGMIIGTLGVICLFYLGKNRTLRLHFLLTIGAFIIGISLAGNWLLPALTHADYASVPDTSLLPERIGSHSITWSFLDPISRTTNIESVYLGLILMIIGIMVVVIFPSRRKAAIFTGALVSIFLSFGTNNPLYKFLPLGMSLFPERFLNFATLLLAVMVIEFGEISFRLHLPRFLQTILYVGILGFAILDFSPYWNLAKTAEYPTVQSDITSLSPQQDLSRLDIRGTTEGSIWASLPLTLYNWPLAYGWSIETTPHLPTFSLHNYALRTGYPEIVLHDYVLWNVRDAIITQEETPLIKTLIDAEFQEVSRNSNNVFLRSSSPTTPVMKLNSNGIVIGRGSETAVLVYPWLTRGYSWFLDDYPTDYFDPYQLIILYDFRIQNQAEAEKRIRSWVAAGKTVLVDMTGSLDISLFEVQPISIDIPRMPVFHLDSKIDFSYQDPVSSEPFEYEGTAWRGVSYFGLSGEILGVEDSSGRISSVLGFKNLPEGRLYFLGLNWMTHALSTHDQTSTKFLDQFFQRANPNRELSMPGFPLQFMYPPADNWGFSYQSDQTTHVVVSETWSLHWEATLDGEPISVYNHENLIRLLLPAGFHKVIFQYGTTPVTWMGWGITIVFIIFLAFLWYYYGHLEKRLAIFENWLSH